MFCKRPRNVGSAVQTVGVGDEFVDMFCSLTEYQFIQKLITKHATSASQRGLHSRPYDVWEIVGWALPTMAVVLRGIAQKTRANKWGSSCVANGRAAQGLLCGPLEWVMNLSTCFAHSQIINSYKS